MADIRKNFCIILPEVGNDSSGSQEGGVEVMINVEKGELGRLKQNELFTKFAQWECD